VALARSRRILVATGLRDELRDIPGLAARWGTDVLHCPYCHGWEVRDRRIGVLATGPMAVHQALLFRQLSPHVTLLQHTGPAPDDEQREQLDALGMPVIDGTVVKVESDGTGLTGSAPWQTSTPTPQPKPQPRHKRSNQRANHLRALTACGCWLPPW